jgi:hypothetical protein
MAECDAQSLQIDLCHIGQDLEIDGILGKDRRVLHETNLIEPARYFVVVAHCARSRAFFFIAFIYPLGSNALTQIKIFSGARRIRKLGRKCCGYSYANSKTGAVDLRYRCGFYSARV